MRHLVSVCRRELSHFARECVKWTLVGVVCLAAMWFLTDGLPRVVAVINGLTAAHISHSGAAQLDAPSHLTYSR